MPALAKTSVAPFMTWRGTVGAENGPLSRRGRSEHFANFAHCGTALWGTCLRRRSVQKVKKMSLTKTLIPIVVALCLLESGCSSSVTSFRGYEKVDSTDKENSEASRDCDNLRPENPYSPGSGHYAGFEWAERNDPGACGGNSTSFIEGCEAYQEQVAAYENCLNKR